MCKRIVFNMSKQVLEKNYGKLFSGFARSNFNISPGSKMLVKVEGEDHLSWSNWGLTPYKSKQIKDFEKLSCLDLRDIKSVIGKNSKRCIIPASAFYDWVSDKNPFIFLYPRYPHFAFAGICENWDLGNGKQIHSFAILLTKLDGEPKELNGSIPITMNAQNSKNWLENEEIMVNDTPAFMLSPTDLIARPASEEVIDPNNNHSGLMKKGQFTGSGENYKLF